MNNHIVVLTGKTKDIALIIYADFVFHFGQDFALSELRCRFGKSKQKKREIKLNWQFDIVSRTSIMQNLQRRWNAFEGILGWLGCLGLFAEQCKLLDMRNSMSRQSNCSSVRSYVFHFTVLP